jgi:hypothetical protein
VGAAYAVQELIDLLFVLEIALLLRAVGKEHDKIRDRPERALSGKASFGHGDTLENAADIRIDDVISAVNEEAVEINCLFTDPAGTDLSAVLFIIAQNVGSEFDITDGLWSKQDNTSV